MDPILDMARDLAAELQQDGRYLRLRLAQAAADEDAALQEAIGEFNLKRLALQNEEQKSEIVRDTEKIQTLDEEVRTLYEKIMSTPVMAAYNAARSEVEQMVNGVTRILTLAAQGANPDEIEDSQCSGNCGGCSGCH